MLAPRPTWAPAPITTNGPISAVASTLALASICAKGWMPARTGGGGLKSGVIVGSTDPDGVIKEPKNPVAVADLYATIFTALGVDFAKEVITPIGRPMAYCQGKAVQRLVDF